MGNVPYKTYLAEDEVPKAWYNVRADMKKKPAPLVHPATKEPLPADHPYLKMQHPERLLLTPHIGWASREARICLVEKIAANIQNTFKNL